MVRPLALIWPGDSETYYADDQFMIGPSIMVAPVYQRNSKEGMFIFQAKSGLISTPEKWSTAVIHGQKHLSTSFLTFEERLARCHDGRSG